MSINSALLSGVSGLLANAAKLGTISDNIANVNTVGYKRNQTDFQTIVTAASGNRGAYSAGGVLAQSFQRVSQQGQLQRTGNAYLASNESGSFNLKTPGTGGAGLLSSATLEASTVDLSTEFTGLITTQRAYSASSKIITTADEMLDELIRIKR